jgi:hypothetical protein
MYAPSRGRMFVTPGEVRKWLLRNFDFSSKLSRSISKRSLGWRVKPYQVFGVEIAFFFAISMTKTSALCKNVSISLRRLTYLSNFSSVSLFKKSGFMIVITIIKPL